MGVISKTELHHSSAGVEKQAGDGFALKLPPGLWRFAKFCMVGGSGVLVDMTLLYLLADPSRLGWNITLSKICAAELAMINNFTWNEHWTFRSPSSAGNRLPDRLGRFLRFNSICGVGIGFAVLLLHLFHARLGWNLYLSNFAAVVLVTSWNYWVNARFNWSVVNSRPNLGCLKACVKKSNRRAV